jgi:hypothetical protein
MIKTGCSAEEARERLKKADGFVRAAIEGKILVSENNNVKGKDS